ncbi:MAG: tetratricopeptide repeat protein [Duganella sp.]
MKQPNRASLASSIVLATTLALSAPAFAAAPTVHDVYVAAEAGKYAEAQTMMDQVLKEHPNSATAHFVEAELLAKQGKFAAAQQSLATAERISPGLPKVNAGAVSNLKALIAKGEANGAGNAGAHARQPAPAKTSYGNSGNGGYANAPESSPGIPWGSVLLMGGLLVGFIFVVSRFMQRRQQQQLGGGMGNTGNAGGFNPGYNPGNPPAPGYPPGGYPQQGYPQQGYPQGQPQGSGMGSRIMGGLATGAAVGAGFVAAEAIARQFGGYHDAASSGATDGGRNDIIYEDPNRSNIVQNDDMGGSDFGVSGGWDDGGAGGGDAGGDEWN